MKHNKSRPKRGPTPFSMGDWLSKEETKRTFREWQAREMRTPGVQNPRSPPEGTHSTGQSAVRTNPSKDRPTPAVEDPEEDLYELVDADAQDPESKETEAIREAITVELDARFDHAFEKLEELASEIERTKISVDELRGHVGEALRDLDEQTRFCRREIRMLRDRRPKTVGDFMALNNPP